eukprot:PITA_02765
MARNLISVSNLDDAGVKIVFEKDTCKMVRGALVLMQGVRTGTLYKLQGGIVVDGCNSSVVPESGAENLVVSGERTMLWHQRLGHIGEKGLRILHGKGMVEGMSNNSLDFDLCENCVYGKHNRGSFPSGKKKIKVLRTDNGGEFYSKEFEEFYKKCGIARQTTTPYTPQQNGVAERMNKTLMERVRSMLNGFRLGHEFWAKAVDIACYLVNGSPSSVLEDKTPQENYEEAVDSEDGKLWKEAMVDEMASLYKNEAWDLVELPARRKPIGSKWVFKKKTNAEGTVEKYKSRLVEKCYSQVLGIDFGDIFSPIAKVTSIRLLLSVVAAFDFEVEQMDVKTTFLHRDLEEEIYMKQLEGFAVKGKKELDSKPVKVAIPIGVKLSAEQCPKTQEEEEDMSRVPYASAVGSLMYAMVCTRPHIKHAVGALSKFISKPGKEHWIVVKRVFKYLRGTSDYGLCYQGRLGLDKVLDICGLVDADRARDLV